MRTAQVKAGLQPNDKISCQAGWPGFRNGFSIKRKVYALAIDEGAASGPSAKACILFKQQATRKNCGVRNGDVYNQKAVVGG